MFNDPKDEKREVIGDYIPGFGLSSTELMSSSYDILRASTVGLPKFFSWIHFVEPTTKIRIKYV